jgi:hypothetical protein
MSNGDGMNSNNRVHVVWHVWAPVATSYHARQEMLPLPETPKPVEPIQY